MYKQLEIIENYYKKIKHFTAGCTVYDCLQFEFYLII